ncbi:uncharacterized protein PGTG_04648 [Puccinia graminis f. sp. tritici CRL 75-36-700-3]|uniref:Uncharacterized protein n=1 Tax=Puccinia graminis f. sp. tritici (strain CRL 75-36-700-3 / race SCCL) TaxID=418459 RepID=E3K3P0_PUCGT|nr:uncharacterized protein PGTG_04648 [Puccinia graminis f. sp. tritici CRL 75-36-700-3]EFP78692.2 hypothetical protein PGTG_04648 [Puccinia graminis f. sp. tritici CRL 75-36-700-3]
MKRPTKTLKFAELQAWRQDNPYILTGYRPNLPSMVACLKSIFGYFHNETVNIHTHLWGAVLFCLLIFSLSKPSQYIPWGIRSLVDGTSLSSSVTWKDTFVFGTFFLSGMSCLGFSALFHTFSCHSHKVCSTFGRLDYIGIVWLTVGSFYPSIYYGFFCHGKVIATYLIMITTLGAFATYTVVSPAYRSNSGRRDRTIMVIALGLSGIFPSNTPGLFHMPIELGCGGFLAQGQTYILGAVFYAERFPERLIPGKFDLMGSSHQIFHTLILMAAGMHYLSVLKAFKFAHDPSNSSCLL